MKAEELMKYKNWVVVGDVSNSIKYAYKILQELKQKGYNASGVNPRGKSEDVYINLKDVNYKIDVVDLCINPVMGIGMLKEVRDLNIDKILIQPGAGSNEILDYCRKNGIAAIEGCALVELSRKLNN